MPGPPFVSTFACSTRFAKVSFDERGGHAMRYGMPRLRPLNIRAMVQSEMEGELERKARARIIIIDVTTLAPFLGQRLDGSHDGLVVMHFRMR